VKEEVVEEKASHDGSRRQKKKAAALRGSGPGMGRSCEENAREVPTQQHEKPMLAM
jgi:hypothetical protein